MNIHLPYQSYTASLRILSDEDLRKQCRDAYTIVGMLTGFQFTNHLPIQKKVFWEKYAQHPDVLLWKGYSRSLTFYCNTALALWEERGFEQKIPYVPHMGYAVKPHFVGDPQYHKFQQSQLVAKNPVRYGTVFKDIPPDLEPYYPPKPKKGGST